MSEPYIYRLLPPEDWAAAEQSGLVPWNADDERDGFAHLSTGAQAAETYRRYYAGRGPQVLLKFETAALADKMKWEPSRGGALFPHYYGRLPADKVIGTTALADEADSIAALEALA